MRAKVSTNRASNDVHGAALAIAVLNFMQPDLIRSDRKYDRMVDKIFGDYLPLSADHTEEDMVFWEARRLKEVLSGSDVLIHALAGQRT